MRDCAGKELQFTIDINRVQERESLDLEVWGSPNGADWGSRPLLRIPRKYHCGASLCRLDLSGYPAVRFLRVEYRLNAEPGNLYPFVKISISGEEAAERALVAAH